MARLPMYGAAAVLFNVAQIMIAVKRKLPIMGRQYPCVSVIHVINARKPALIVRD